jgi:hypothetical protein
MNTDELLKEMIEKNAILEQELQAMKTHLKKYTAPERSKIYYQTHKEEILLKKKEASIKHDPVISKERRKEINKRAYQKRKDKNTKVDGEIV